MAKYDALQDWLLRAGDGPVEATFREIDAIVGGLLASARRHAAWWENHRSTHVQAGDWLDIGRRVELVDLNVERVRWSAPAIRGAL